MVVTKNRLRGIIWGKGLIWGVTLFTLIISWLKDIMKSGCIHGVEEGEIHSSKKPYY